MNTSARYQKSKDQSRVLVNGNQNDTLEPIPYTPDCYTVVTDADYYPLPTGEMSLLDSIELGLNHG